MASRLISTSIPNLLNGVSQQPDTIRLPNQAETQENGLSDVVYGLGKRPPTIHVAKLNSDTFENSKVHFINRDSTERYTVLINNGLKSVNNNAGSGDIYDGQSCSCLQRAKIRQNNAVIYSYLAAHTYVAFTWFSCPSRQGIGPE